jgi:hypothetical protein
MTFKIPVVLLSSALSLPIPQFLSLFPCHFSLIYATRWSSSKEFLSPSGNTIKRLQALKERGFGNQWPG